MDTKVWWQSKSMWGGIVAVLSGIAGVLGYNFGPEDQELVAVSITSIVTVVASLVAVFGRVKAADKITLKKE